MFMHKCMYIGFSFGGEEGGQGGPGEEPGEGNFNGNSELII